MNKLLIHQQLSKNKLALFFLMFIIINCNAQQNIDSLEYGVDNIPAFGQANKMAVPPATNVSNFPFNVSLTAISSGFHLLFVRTHSKTTSAPIRGYWSETNYAYFFKQPNSPATANASKLEYFIDTDPGEGLATPINITPAVQVSGINFSPNISALTSGFHVVFIRSLDANGKWSITNYQYFFKQYNAALVSNATKLEYFIDTDPGEGHANPISITPAVQVSGINFSPNISALSGGFHVVFIRSLDANGKWSITNYQYFFKQYNAAIISNVNKLEYFIDTDPGPGNGHNVPLTPATIIPGLDINVDISSLTPGFHVIFLRSLDANGKWSITNYVYFSKAGPQTATPVNIVKIEYFIDTDPGYYSAINIPVTAAPDIANKSFSANVTGLSLGTHYLYIRSLDSRGKWSLNDRDSFHILSGLPITLLNFSASPEGSSVNLAWQTTFEQNLMNYEVEYSVDGITFSKIGMITPTNNALGSTYSFKHLTPVKGINFYRLKVIESDNSFHYSDIRLVNFSEGKSLVNIYPDPADKYFQIKSDLPQYTIKIFSADGKIVKTMKSNTANVEVEVRDLPSGLYTVRISSENLNSNTLLIIKH